MRRTGKILLLVITACGIGGCGMLSSCKEADDDRIPALPVSINLSDAGMWNVYGVSGTGIHRSFNRTDGIPAGFHYSEGTYTGFGGVLLIGGVDPFDSNTNVPLAYDLSCPVECKKDIRVYIDDNNLEAVCQKCGSRYNVVMGGGIAVSGQAYDHKPRRYALRRYRCIPSGYGGYMIRD